MDPIRGHHRASPATRASARFTLAFGHVAVAVAAYPATASADVLRRHEFTSEGHQVGRLRIDKADRTFVDPADVIMCATASNGTTVELPDHELAAVLAIADAPVPVEWLVPQRVLWDGSYLVRSTYHLRQREPDRRERVNPRRDALGAVLETLRQENAAALLRPVLAGRLPRWCALVPDGRLLALCFADEVRVFPPPPAAPSGHAVAEARRAARRIGRGIPVLANDAATRVQQFVDEKADVVRPEVMPFGSITDLGARLGARPAEGKRGLRRRRPRP